MAEPIEIDGKLWHRAEDGSWFVWDPAAARWAPSQAPPQHAPPPQAAPPPPPPPSGSSSPQRPPASGSAARRSVSASRDFVAAGGGARLAPSPVVIAAVALVVAVVAAASLFVLTQDDVEPEPAGAAPVTTPPPSGPISPRGERNIYSVLGRVNECFGPETLAWAGELRSGQLDRAGLKDDIARISKNVADLRGRRFPERVDAKLVPRDRVGKLAAKIAAADISSKDAKIDTRILVTLGIMPRGADLEKLGREVVSEGIAGFYVPEDKRLYAGVGEQGFVPFDEIVLAHELDHALMDATIGLPPLVSDDPLEGDRFGAARAAVEGDATLAMLHYAVASFDQSEWQALLSDPAAAGSLDVEQIPYVLQRSLAFPYQEGLLFACDLFSRGGWKDVERSLREPPTSTDQILFPGRYLRQTTAVDAPDPGAPAGWEPVRAMSIGASDLLWMIQAARGPSADDPAAGIDAVRGWAGGELHAWQKAGDMAVQITLVDGGIGTKGDKVRYTLCRSLRSWYEDEFDGARSLANGKTDVWRNADRFAALSCANKTPRLAIAPDRPTAEALVAPE